METKQPHCKKCKGLENLKISSSSICIDGKKRYSYMCTKCNTISCKRYRNTPKGKENIYKAVYKSISLHKDKQNARILLNYHIKQGNLIKPKYCEICKNNSKLEAHHSDYTKPLLVCWLCKKCHSNLHSCIDKVHN